MSAMIALLRGVNVGKGKPVAMDALAAMMAALGFAGARTLLRSGNIVFDPRGQAPEALEALLQRELEARLGLKSQVFVRTAEAWRQALAHNPFPEKAAGDPSHLLLYALKEAPGPDRLEALQAAIPGPERIGGFERHLYVDFPAGIATTTLTPALWARFLPPGTGRNWNTARKLAAMAED
jgi:uncharacterized protein (DUF1697 family)